MLSFGIREEVGVHGRQVGSPILLVFVLVSLSVLVGASPASAACDDEETLFVRKTITRPAGQLGIWHRK